MKFDGKIISAFRRLLTKSVYLEDLYRQSFKPNSKEKKKGRRFEKINTAVKIFKQSIQPGHYKYYSK